MALLKPHHDPVQGEEGGEAVDEEGAMLQPPRHLGGGGGGGEITGACKGSLECARDYWSVTRVCKGLQGC